MEMQVIIGIALVTILAIGRYFVHKKKGNKTIAMLCSMGIGLGISLIIIGLNII